MLYVAQSHTSEPPDFSCMLESVTRRRGHISWDALPDGMGLGLARSSVPEQTSDVSLCSCFGFKFPYHIMYGLSPYFLRAPHDCCRVTLLTDSWHFLCWNSGLKLVPHCITMAYASEIHLVLCWNGSEWTLEIEVFQIFEFPLMYLIMLAKSCYVVY